MKYHFTFLEAYNTVPIQIYEVLSSENVGMHHKLSYDFNSGENLYHEKCVCVKL